MERNTMKAQYYTYYNNGHHNVKVSIGTVPPAGFVKGRLRGRSYGEKSKRLGALLPRGKRHSQARLCASPQGSVTETY